MRVADAGVEVQAVAHDVGLEHPRRVGVAVDEEQVLAGDSWSLASEVRARHSLVVASHPSASPAITST